MRCYFQFTDQVQNINKDLNLTQYEIRLLDFATRAHLLSKPIFVGDLIDQREIATQATLHMAFKKLVAKNLLSSALHESDGRVKQITPTTLAMARFKKIQSAIKKLSS